jgi:hypothetical protein
VAFPQPQLRLNFRLTSASLVTYLEAVEDAESYGEDIVPLLEANAASVAGCTEEVSRLLSEPADPAGAKAVVTRWQYVLRYRL